MRGKPGWAIVDLLDSDGDADVVYIGKVERGKCYGSKMVWNWMDLLNNCHSGSAEKGTEDKDGNGKRIDTRELSIC